MIDWRTVLDLDGYESRPGVDVQTVQRAESKLGRRLPSDLVPLYRDSDGVLDLGGEWFVIWPIEMLVAENLARWDASDLPRHLLAFGDDGAGYPFCLQDHQPPVICWYPIEEEGTVLAPDIESFWRGWTSGSITT